MFENIHQTIEFKASASTLFEAILDSDKHASFTAAAASISREAGGRLQAYDDWIEGRNVEIVPGKRIVQAWRGRNWPEGAFSIARFDFEDTEGGCRIVLTHTGVPTEKAEDIEEGWHKMYWRPLTAWLDKQG